MAREYMIEAYRARVDARMAERLEAPPVTMEGGTSDAWMQVRDAAMHGLGVGHMHEMRSVVTGIFLPVWRVELCSKMGDGA
jgi:hypothetical protein